jgi:hypothetical protein
LWILVAAGREGVVDDVLELAYLAEHLVGWCHLHDCYGHGISLPDIHNPGRGIMGVRGFSGGQPGR